MSILLIKGFHRN